MTILGYLLPEYTPWGSFWDTGPDWGERSMASPWFDRWREPVLHSPRARQIPIQIESPGYFDEWEEWSDSDCDDFNINTNSKQTPPQRKRFRPASSRLPPSDSEPLSVESIDLDFDRNETRRKTPLRNSSSKYRETENLTRPPLYKTRSSAKEIKEKPDFIICDSDIENDINDTCSYSVYQYLKGFLNSTGRQIDQMKGDGNCFFRALSKVIYGNQSFYNEIRQAVVDVLEEYPKKFEAFTDGPMSEHIKSMRQDKTWATQTEIYAAATLLNRDIYILSPDQNGENYRWLLFKPQFKYNSSVTGCKCYITICHTHGNHYDRIAAINGKCNCKLPVPEMSGISESVDLTKEDDILIV